MFIAHGDLEVIGFKGICFLMDPKVFWICTFTNTLHVPVYRKSLIL